MGRYALLVHQSIGSDAEALFGPLDHRARRADLRLSDRTPCLDIDDEAVAGIPTAR